MTAWEGLANIQTEGNNKEKAIHISHHVNVHQCGARRILTADRQMGRKYYSALNASLFSKLRINFTRVSEVNKIA